MRCFEERKWRPSLESLLTTLYSAQPGLKKRMFRWTISSITKKLSKIHNNNSQRDHWGFNNYRYFLAWHPARTRFGPAGGNRTKHQNRAQLPKFWLIENPFTMILRYACLKHLIIFSFNFLRCFAFSTVGIGPAIREKTERFTAFHRAGCISPMNVLRHQRSIRLRSDRVLSLSVQPATATEYRLDEPITETATAEFDSAALYSAAPGDAVLSLPLRIAGHDWQVVIYPSGQSVPPPPWLGWLASIDEALGPSNRRVGRVGVYLRFLAPHEDAFVDAVFQLQMVISVILQ